MKKTWLLMFLLIFLFSGCNYRQIIDDTVNGLAHSMTDPAEVVEPFIGFSDTEVDDPDLLRKLEPSELENYTSRYCNYNSYVYFMHLNEAEKLLYHAYEYALDEALPYFWVDDRLLEDMERSCFEVLSFLALDSAMVEQNISFTYGGYTVTHTMLDVETAKESYTTVCVSNFSRERLERKEEAIGKARGILAEMTQAEITEPRAKAEYFFDYLGQNVVYETDIPGEEYLYTALCQGKTNCDGYTNAFALLCRMSDIPCIELNSENPKDEEGHTWNAVFLEDRWVHVEATGAKDDVTSDCPNRRLERIYFGFPDELLEHRVENADLLPACPEGLTPVLHISSGEVEDFTEQVKQAFRENDRRVAVILVDEGDLQNQITADLATELNCNLKYSYYETVEGKNVYYLFNTNS